MRYRAVLFDLDGTLLDTLLDIAQSANLVLERMALPIHPLDSFRYFVGEGVAVLMTRVLPDSHRTAADVERAVKAFAEVYATRWNLSTRPYARVDEMLVELARRGVRMGVLSNKPHAFTVKCVETLLVTHRFEVVLGQSERFARKPDPAGAVYAAGEMGISPGDFLYLGDSAIDMQTARASGMFAVGAAWGFRTREELAANGAQKIIEHPRELLELL